MVNDERFSTGNHKPAPSEKMTLGVVESATGGLISHLITNIPGSSDVYRGSITAYSNDIKIGVVN